jgi:hypothetical protein
MSSRIETEMELWERISMLPLEVKQIIGNYSCVVAREKTEIKKEFFLHWTTCNVDRLLEKVSKTWTKHQIIWVLMKCSSKYYWHYSLLLTTKGALVSFLRTEITENIDFEDVRKGWQNLKAIEIVNSRVMSLKCQLLKQRRRHERTDLA